MRQDGGTEPAARIVGESIGTPGLAAPPGTPEPAPEPMIDNRLFVLVLQHPQEQDEQRATAAPMVAVLRNARLAVGLSWPNLASVLGRSGDPESWGVLYLGSARPPALKPPEPARPGGGADEIIALGRDGRPLPEADRVLRRLEGIVLLDGTWSQAKTLWWRNPWLLKLRRLVLNPPEPARLGRLRREPRAEALSTLEAAALVLRRLEPGPQPADALLAALDRLLASCGEPPPGAASGRRSDRFSGRFSDRGRGPPARYRDRPAAG
jgi:DTW domain-containing protein